MAITLNSVSYDYIIATEFSEINQVMLPEYANDDTSIDINVWNKGVFEVTYILRATDAQKWALDSLLIGHTLKTLIDDKYGINNSVWVKKIEAEYARDEDEIYRWRITLSLIVI